ncbi:MAG: site-specific integrase [Acidobacteria bacterium]|nr:MAG: site-specific integrase [Acidobacteriota bacterium]
MAANRTDRSSTIAYRHEAIHPRFRVAVSLGAYAGLRLGETLGLQKDNLDLLRRTLTVTHSLTNHNGAVSLGATKTKGSRRTISLGQALCDELAAHLTEYGTGPQGVVMSSPQGSWVRASSWRYRFWHPAVETSVGRPLRYHDLRHTHAALLIAQGAHPKAIQSDSDTAPSSSPWTPTAISWKASTPTSPTNSTNKPPPQPPNTRPRFISWPPTHNAGYGRSVCLKGCLV